MPNKTSPLILALLASLAFVACDSDDEATVVTKDKWIGSPCYCDAAAQGAKCTEMGVPLPTGKPIVGCEALSNEAYPGTEVTCLTTIDKSFKATAPTTYFPKGYCALTAVDCEGDGVCAMVNYGDVKKMTQCPEGSTLLTGKFDYKIILSNVKITNKTCVKNCNTDADCNVAGEMSCISRKGAKFCYHVDNLALLGDNYTVEVF